MLHSDPAIRRAFVDVPWGQLHYREIGSGPVLMLFHQTSISGASWIPVMPSLARNRRVIALDTPGYGDSSGPSEPMPMEWYVEAIRLFMEAAQIEKATLLGHHTGASLAAGLAVRHPHLVDRIILSMPPLFTPEECAAHIARPANAAPLQADGSHLVAVWDHQTFQGSGLRLNLELSQLDVIEASRAWPGNSWAIRALAGADLAADLAALSQPTLVLHNPADPLIRHADALKRVLPNARFEMIPSRTVDVFVECGTAIVPIIDEFVRGAADARG